MIVEPEFMIIVFALVAPIVILPDNCVPKLVSIVVNVSSKVFVVPRSEIISDDTPELPIVEGKLKLNFPLINLLIYI
jgi:hypothetical protein